jgi:hypothetical protein
MLSQLLIYSLEITAVSKEDQLLLLFQYLKLSIGAKMNLHDPGGLKVIKVVRGRRQGR